jgi:hydroxyacylglutathione hydrolase
LIKGQYYDFKPFIISLIILTHSHIDHYGSAEELKTKKGAPIAIHRADAEYLKRGINYIGTLQVYSY